MGLSARAAGEAETTVAASSAGSAKWRLRAVSEVLM
jgi:hypothetical protein